MTAGGSLYQLMPAAYRARDAEVGHPLRALLEVVEQEWLRLRDDVDGLYDDWFIDTCAEWVVPYIGDLLGVDIGAATSDAALSRRAYVANAIRHRRAKGTPGGLEQVARDVTGWPAHVVEYFRLLITTQNLGHPRPGNAHTPDLRATARLDLLGTPFDEIARTVDVRHADRGRGRHNIGDVGVHLWRSGAYPIAGADARAVDAEAGRWTFDPAGRDMPLYTRPGEGRSDPVSVPAPVRRLVLHRQMEALLAEPGPLFRITLSGRAVPARDLICADLTTWARPAPDPDVTRVAVDPVLGRFTLPPGVTPERVRVDFAYGAPGDIGAGPYARAAAPDAAWRAEVSRDTPGDGTLATLGEAIRAWNTRPDPRPGDRGVIVIMDSATYHEDLTGGGAVAITPGGRLALIAAPGTRPHLAGSIGAGVATGGRDAIPSELALEGLSVEGDVVIAPGDLDGLVLAGCTLLASAGSGAVRAGANPRLNVRLSRTVCSSVSLTGVPGLTMSETILYADGDAVDAADSDAVMDACTVLGRSLVRSLTASDTILRERAEVTHRQLGYVRYSYVPLDSVAPRRYRCQPTTAGPVAPGFAATSPADPGFCALTPHCPPEIATGAENGGEMGAFRFLARPRRLADLAAELRHHLRFGLEAGVFFAD
ncbi:hypothetical protein J5X84_24230 [Streptosporangiaceae bacterium NEAU-GS5]|nr:hypothetical protein [Streptosporangiaceae bacterium NEAU-GS5]